MNPLATELNEKIGDANPHVLEMLSPRGKALYFPKGILSQGAEAKEKAHRFNATVGMATEGGHAMALPSVVNGIGGLSPDEALAYAPALGLPELRKAWNEKQLAENPSQKGKITTLPIVTSGLTHGLSLTADLFAAEGDVLLLPDKLWGNYRLMYEVRLGAKVETWPFFDDKYRLNISGLEAKLKELSASRKKIITILNFPNNPIGYNPTDEEGRQIADAFLNAAEAGMNIVAFTDDAYFGLEFTDDAMKESIFGLLANQHPRLMAIKGDAATKEMYVWGFRLGFLTYGPGGVSEDSPMLEALEKKTAGAIRGCISNCPRISQSIVLKALRSPSLADERRSKFEIMKARAEKVKEVLSRDEFADAWDVYPFNSGYFMCLKVKGVNAEELRKHVLDKYGIGLISIGDTDIRVAFSCLEVDHVDELFTTLYKGIKELRGEA